MDKWCPWGYRPDLSSVVCAIPEWLSGILFCLWAIVAAVLAVGAPTIIAPKRRNIVAWSAYTCGASIALCLTYLAFAAGLGSPTIALGLVTALSSGFIAAHALCLRFSRTANNRLDGKRDPS